MEKIGVYPEDGAVPSFFFFLLFRVRIFLGGGRALFFPYNSSNANPYTLGVRKDSKNLVDDWVNKQKGKNYNPNILWNKHHLDNVSEVDFHFIEIQITIKFIVQR